MKANLLYSNSYLFPNHKPEVYVETAIKHILSRPQQFLDLGGKGGPKFLNTLEAN